MNNRINIAAQVLFLLLSFLLVIDTAAQDAFKASYIYDNYRLEYRVDSSAGIAMYRTHHYKVKVNNASGVTTFNKVIISLKGVSEISDFKAIVWNDSVKVKHFKKEQLQRISNYRNQGAHALLALEGVVPGTEVEVQYTVQRKPYLFRYFMLQRSIPVHSSTITVVSDTNLVFTTKAFNCKSYDSIWYKNGKRYVSSYLKNIPAFTEESYAANKANKTRVHIKFLFNKSKGNTEVFTYESARYQLYRAIYISEEGVKKSLKREFKNLKLKGLTEEEKIIRIENYIKTNFEYRPKATGYEWEAVSYIIKYRVANKKGLVKLYLELLTLADIDHQVLVTCNRFKYKLDPTFMSWYFLDEYLIYFPFYNTYAAPTFKQYRYPFIPYSFAGNKGLLLPNRQGASALEDKILVDIPEMSANQNVSDLTVDLHITHPDSAVACNFSYEVSGYKAASFDYKSRNMQPSAKQKFAISFLKRYLGQEALIDTVQLMIREPEQGNKMFTVTGRARIPGLFEYAGNDYLFLAGRLIGKQVQLYEGLQRHQDVELNYRHKVNRQLRISYPEEYNLITGASGQHIAILNGVKEQGAFKESIRRKQGRIELEVNEGYDFVVLPAYSFSDFQKVINAAAAFNNKVLLLQRR